jgi:cell division septal protein FtsQ
MISKLSSTAATTGSNHMDQVRQPVAKLPRVKAVQVNHQQQKLHFHPALAE